VSTLASLTAVVTGSAAVAFALSSLFVFGIGSALQASLAIYFSPGDYVRITPSWAIPPLVLGALYLLAYGVSNLVRVRDEGTGFATWESLFDALQGIGKQRVGMPCSAFGFCDCASFCLQVLLPRQMWSAYLISFSRVSSAIKALLVSTVCLLSFATTLGYFEKSAEIYSGSITRVFFESEKDKVARLEGKVIFDLDRYLLLLTESKQRSVVAIPHEKIKSIQTPPLPQEQVSAGD
jgi:hypothetical protein